MWIRVLTLAAAITLGGCLRPLPPERPLPTEQPAPAATLAATRVARPTLGPSFDSAQDAVEARGPLAAPDAPSLLSGRTLVITEYQDDCRWVGDVLLRWRHGDPPGVDFYEVRHSLDAPYDIADLEGTTTGLRFASDAPGQDFVWNAGPAGQPSGCVGVDIMSRIDTWVVRACNDAGCSADSNAIGAVTFSLAQGNDKLPSW